MINKSTINSLKECYSSFKVKFISLEETIKYIKNVPSRLISVEKFYEF